MIAEVKLNSGGDPHVVPPSTDARTISINKIGQSNNDRLDLIGFKIFIMHFICFHGRDEVS